MAQREYYEVHMSHEENQQSWACEGHGIVLTGKKIIQYALIN